MEITHKMAILEVGGDVYKISTESVLGTFGHRIEQFLDKEYQSSTFIKYIIRRPKEPTVAIIEYCNTGLLHIPPNVCKGSFQTELQFWGLNPSLLEKCCYHKFCSFLNDQKKLEGFENMYKRNTNIGNKKRPTVKERTWEVVSCQGKSKWSKMYFYVSTAFVLLVVCTLALTTLHNNEYEAVDQNATAQPEPDNMTTAIPQATPAMFSSTNNGDKKSGPKVIIDPAIGITIIDVDCDECPAVATNKSYWQPRRPRPDEVLHVNGLTILVTVPSCCSIDHIFAPTLVKPIEINFTRHEDENLNGPPPPPPPTQPYDDGGFQIHTPETLDYLNPDDHPPVPTQTSDTAAGDLHNRTNKTDDDANPVGPPPLPTQTSDTAAEDLHNRTNKTDDDANPVEPPPLPTQPFDADSMQNQTKEAEDEPTKYLVPENNTRRPLAENRTENDLNIQMPNGSLIEDEHSSVSLFNISWIQEPVTFDDINFTWPDQDIFQEKTVSAVLPELIETFENVKEKLSPIHKTLGLQNINGDGTGFLIELITTIFFTIELTLRFVSCPDRKEYLRGVLNWIDMILVTASLARIVITLLENIQFKIPVVFDLLLYLQMFRVLRLFRTIEHVKAFKVLRYSLVIGAKDICVLLMYILVTMCIFSNFIYFVEKKSDFPSIPAAWWWSIVTMTTVGYGDMVPHTVPGKLIGGLCALSGVILFSLIIPVFVNTFLSVYQYANESLEDEGKIGIKLNGYTLPHDWHAKCTPGRSGYHMDEISTTQGPGQKEKLAVKMAQTTQI